MPAAPGLVTVAEAAALLGVSEGAIRGWISDGRVPYLVLPSGAYRVPQGALLAALGDVVSLGDELAQIDCRTASLTEDQVRAVLD